MSQTSLSLLDSLRLHPDESAWKQLFDLYTPFVRSWLYRLAATPQDADDIIQEVLLVLVRRLPEFQHAQRPGSFRRWLLGITVNCLRTHRRGQRSRPAAIGDSQFQQTLEQLADPESSLSRQWDVEHDRHVVSQLLERIRPRFEAKTWTAFHRTTIEGIAPGQVAIELGMTVNAVFIAKSRVLTQLRQQGKGLLDE